MRKRLFRRGGEILTDHSRTINITLYKLYLLTGDLAKSCTLCTSCIVCFLLDLIKQRVFRLLQLLVQLIKTALEVAPASRDI
ncbi:hypothetical protein B7G68_13035 [Caulobacter segnis]|uniref:Uncharacterized protein n=1 Tax=Caulobacter segnis TaxID=88688 RepID=A0ABN5IUE8_9CAUL|nr:hypothetical protein B7G68_13035 [Caulobacter segnis]